MNKDKRINILLRKTNQGEGKKGNPNSLNATERRFFLKHPNQVREVFKGERSHVRANKIVLKMLALDLNLDDFDEVYESFKDRKI